MLIENREDVDNYEKLLNDLITDLESKGYSNIKADLPDYEKPTQLTRRNDQEAFLPDVTALKNGKKYYFEIARKTGNLNKVVGKWKLLSLLAQMKNGSFKLYVPYGNMRFTNDLIKKHDIDAQVIKI